MFRKSLEVSRAMRGEAHPGTAAILGNLGVTLTAQGKLAEADPLLRGALEVRRAVLGESHPDTAAAYVNLANNLERQGRYAEATPLFHSSLDINRKALGEEHPSTATSYLNLGCNANAMGRYDDAEVLLRKALAVKLKSLGAGHPEIATIYESLAVCPQPRAVRRGRAVLPGALDINRKSLGEGLAATAASYHGLALAQLNLGRYTEAEALFRRALGVRRDTLGEGHPDTAETYAGLALALRQAGRYPMRAARAAGTRHPPQDAGRNAPPHGASYGQLAADLHYQGRYADAEPLYRRCSRSHARPWEKHTRIQRRGSTTWPPTWPPRANTPKPSHSCVVRSRSTTPRSVTTRWNGRVPRRYGINLFERGRYADAELPFREALTSRTALGEGHPRTAFACRNLGAALADQARYADAEPLFRRSSRPFAEALGENHPATADIYGHLALCLDAQGRWPKRSRSTRPRPRASSVRGAAGNHGPGARTRPRRLRRFLPWPSPSHAGTAARGVEAWEADLARGLLDDLTARTLRPLSAAERQGETELLVRLRALDEQIGRLAGRPRRSPDDESRLELLFRERDTLYGKYAEFEQSLAAAHGDFTGRPPIWSRSRPPCPRTRRSSAGSTSVTRGALGHHSGCIVRAGASPSGPKSPGPDPEGRGSPPMKRGPPSARGIGLPRPGCASRPRLWPRSGSVRCGPT